MQLEKKKPTDTRSSFWAIRCDSGKKYSQVVEHKFHISMAALDPGETATSPIVSLILECSGAQYVLCNLRPTSIPQVNLDLNFETGEEIAFSIRGSGAVHLSGYYIYNENDSKPDAKSNVRIEKSGQKISKRKSENAKPVKNVKMKEINDDSEESDKKVKHLPMQKQLTPLIKETEESSDSEEDDEDYEELCDAESESTESDEERSRSSKLKMKSKKRPIDIEEDSDDSIDDYMSDSCDEEDDVQVLVSPKKSAPVQNKKQKMNASTPILANKAAAAASPKKVSFPNLENETGKSSAKLGKSQAEKFTPGSLDSSIGRTPMPKKTVSRIQQGKANDSIKSKLNADSDSDSDTETLQLNKSISESEKETSSAPHNTSADLTGSKKKKKKKKKSLTAQANSNVPGSASNESFSSASSPKYSKKLPSGVEYHDIRAGNGPPVKKGRLVHVYYTGMLDNNKVFDSVQAGAKPFSFRLGSGQVIKGWEIGVEGMKAGGKRRLKIPAHLGYGKQKMGPIPANSTLHFVVELKAVS